MSKIDPKISKYMSDLAKSRKNPYQGFKDPKKAKAAGDKGRASQAATRKAEDVSKPTQPADGK